MPSVRVNVLLMTASLRFTWTRCLLLVLTSAQALVTPLARNNTAADRIRMPTLGCMAILSA
eukprot:15293050-Alexandrium_andersonii.AAC.1